MADEESQTREALGAMAAVLAVRTHLDELAVDVLVAPGMSIEAGERIAEYVSRGALERGHAALARLREINDPGAAVGEP